VRQIRLGGRRPAWRRTSRACRAAIAYNRAASSDGAIAGHWCRPGGHLSDAVDLVSNTVRRRLLRDGAGSLSEAEWHLLRVSHLLNAAERGTLGRVLADTPIAELLDVADGLDAIGAPNAGQRLRTATEKLTVANDPGNGLGRDDTVARSAALLGEQLAAMRAEIERQLLEFAVRHRERMTDAVATR
jgi:hypothetical protein